jgi:UDP-N-acetylmuramoyl-L-alanyl-D-glutamate--2,6-diaminopimelate ligase
MNLHKLVNNISEINLAQCLDLNIKGIAVDPKLCLDGYLYVADIHETVDSSQFGLRLDGRDFITAAIEHGAVAVLTTPDQIVNQSTVPYLFHHQPLSILGLLYKRFYQFKYPKHIALVTGTDGKTSTVNFTKQLLGQLGIKSCSIGNLGAITNDHKVLWPPHFSLTVPDTLTLHKVLANCESQQINSIIAEATSHALYEYRLSHIPAQVGVFTNLTPEHLNFHHNMEEYFHTKMRLFQDVLPTGSYAVICADSDYYPQIKTLCQQKKHHVISVGYRGESIKLIKIHPNAQGQYIHFQIAEKYYQVQLNLHGAFQVFNLMTSLGILIAFGHSIEDVIYLIPRLTEIEGRFNTIGFTPSGGQIIVDFAHTINGLKQALLALGQICKGKTYVLMGAPSFPNLETCQQMAILASKMANHLIITDSHAPNKNLAELRQMSSYTTIF